MSESKSNANPTRNQIGSDEIDGLGVRFFDDAMTDNVLDTLLELTAAVWVCQDRLLVLEEVIADAMDIDGSDLSERVEQHIPSQKLQEQRAQQRPALIAKVFRSFSRSAVKSTRSAAKQTGK